MEAKHFFVNDTPSLVYEDANYQREELPIYPPVPEMQLSSPGPMDARYSEDRIVNGYMK